MNDVDWAAMADMMEDEGEVNSPYVRQALEELSDLAPQRILDVGSGPGVAACHLATAFPQAEVTAVDGTPQLLARAEARADRLGLRLRTQKAEFPAGLAELGSADLIWSALAMHHVGDQLDALKQLAGALKPGGVLALTEGGLPTRWLPHDLGLGRPGLQVRMDAAMDERYNQMREELPDSTAVIEDWPGLLRESGLVDVWSRTFLVEHPAPLAEQPRRWVRAWVERYRTMSGDDLGAEDLATLDRLLDPADPSGVDRRTDLFFLAARSVHFGRRPEH